MAHEKYIKRGNKIFGPYVYENYRENGITKTRYLGLGKKKTNKKLLLFIILAVVFVLVLFFSFSGLLFGKEKIFEKSSGFLGEIASLSPFDFLSKLFISISPINVFVRVVSTVPPIIFGIPDEILVCETNDLTHSFPASTFRVYDSNLDSLTVDINPKNPFFINSKYIYNYSFGFLETDIISWPLNKIYICNDRPGCVGRKVGSQGWATWAEIIYATDGNNPLRTASANTNITIIETNKPPKVDIGTKTIDLLYTRGENSFFYYDAGDYLWKNYEETPTGELIFNLNYQNSSIAPFNISDLGVINIIGNESLIDKGNISKVYNLTICVNDTGIKNPHKNISLCSGYGFFGFAVRDCENFSLTVTKQNRPPKITSYFPINLSLGVAGTDVLYFNATAYDPDWNLLDFYWYVDDVGKEPVRGTLFDKFEYSFGCGDIGGEHKVRVLVTDGLLNDSIEWNLSVGEVSCTPPITSGGGGGGGRLYCEEKWGCNDWKQCESLNELLKGGWVSKSTELLIKERCEIFNYTEEFCGFQARICTDFNYCNTTINKPGDLRECYYTENPNCTDSIKNCHDGACEILTDCGGPCTACPTCGDKIQNQGEEGIDCGGVCEPCKELPFKPIVFKSVVSYSLIALLILVLILVLKQGWAYYKSKKRAEINIKRIIKQEKTFAYRLLFIIFIVLILFFANIYITNLAPPNRIILEQGKEGFLGSQSLFNSILRGFAKVFIMDIGRLITGADADLVVWSDTDNAGVKKYTLCTEYCPNKYKSLSDWEVYFYANYTNKTGKAINSANGDGNCSIKFYDGGFEIMSFNQVSSLWEYNRSFRDKGELNLNINCTSSYENLSIDSVVEISNTEPYIFADKTPDGFIKEPLNCVEDALCYYNFSANVSEDDLNDNLVYGYSSTGNTTLTDFTVNPATGILEVNITDSKETGQNKRVELTVRDDESSTKAILLEVNVAEVNDAPFFIGLENKTFNSDDLFEYIVNISDEETNVPFKVNISFLSCSNEVKRGNCTLFDYSVDEMQGRINISFLPTENDVGSYVINFSVMDNSSLGNKTTSQIINFTVNLAVWNKSLSFDYLLNESEWFYLNLSEGVMRENMNFSNGSSFPSFNLASNGIINFTPVDEDVGYHKVEITASNEETSSSKIFNFTVLNVNDNPFILPLQVGQVGARRVERDSNISLPENRLVDLLLFVQDDDFKIPSNQKSFYDEKLNLNLTIAGPNASLFNFDFSGIINFNQALFTAGFIPRSNSVGIYNITINVTDASNISDVFKFNLTIYENDYDIPSITYPNSSAEFNLKENVTSDLIFRANHTVGDNLTYNFYINDILKNSTNYYGDNRNLTWSFTPNFTEETYENEIKNLTLLVLNPLFPELNTSMTWNLTINHTNAPPELIREIWSQSTTYNERIIEQLQYDFTDIDYYDPHYNQNLSFIVMSNSTPTNIGYVISNWTVTFTPLISSPFSELLNITAYDLNETGGKMSEVTSNNFIIKFTEPPTVQVPVPTSGGGATIPISLKIIMPGHVSAYEHETIIIPLQLINSGQKSFDDLSLGSSAFKNGSIVNWVNTSLSKNYFKSLNPGQKEDLNLTVFFDTDKIGDYEILVNVTSKSPVYTDWGKIHINLQRINDSQIRELIVFTEEFVVRNPQCIEITEVVTEAKKYFEQGDFPNAKLKTEEALSSCKDAISQTSVPKKKTQPFGISWYLVFAILSAFVVGIAYYFFKRRKIQNTQIQEIKLKAMQEAKPST